eukprot:m.8935 g.8935  ORF g.8935 m.8935 type:complete len:119 (+) comp20990_c0_seq1:39-395(+)
MDSPWATVRAGWNIFDTLDVNDDLCRHMYQDELIERDEWDKMKLTNAQNSDKVRQLLFDILPSKDDSWRKFSNILIRTSQGHFLEKLKKQGNAGVWLFYRSVSTVNCKVLIFGGCQKW